VAQNVIDWVWKHSRAVNGSLIVLLAIAHEADGAGMTTMATLELARKARLSDRSVQIAVKDLVALGELEVCLEGGGRGRHRTYRVPANPEDSSGFSPRKGADSSGFSSERVQILRGSGEANPEESSGFNGGPPKKPHVRETGASNPEESSGFQTSDVFITSTGRDEVQVKDVPAIASRPDVERLCQHLADRIEANGCKRPAVTKRWRDSARLMLDRDGRTEQQIATAIDWCQDNEFWRSNILSMPKLREKYDQLRLQASRKPASSRQAETDELFGAAMKRAMAKEGRK
jgi:hypothetical protein